MLTPTLVGTLGRSSTAFERKVVANLGVAGASSAFDTYFRTEIRKDALDGAVDTVLPIAVPLGTIVIATAVFIRVVNSAKVIVTTDEGGTPEPQTLLLGTPDHPEGFYCWFGTQKILSISIEDVNADRTEVEVWVAGNGVTP